MSKTYMYGRDVWDKHWIRNDLYQVVQTIYDESGSIAAKAEIAKATVSSVFDQWRANQTTLGFDVVRFQRQA